jgi:hypothetical protein
MIGLGLGPCQAEFPRPMPKLFAKRVRFSLPESLSLQCARRTGRRTG